MDRGNSRSRPNRALTAPARDQWEVDGNRSVYSAIEDLLTPLGKLAALVVGGGAIAYMCGWQYLGAYFARVGASWVLNLLSPTTVILATLPALFLIVVFTAAVLTFAHTGMKSRTMLWIAGVSAAFLAFFLASFYFVNGEDVAAGILGGLQIFGILFLSAALGYVALSVTEGALRPLEAKVIIYSALILSLLASGMTTAGRAAAQIDFYIGTTRLPIVATLDEPGSTWRLVMALDNTTFLICKPMRNDQDVVLRVIQQDDIAGIFPGNSRRD